MSNELTQNLSFILERAGRQSVEFSLVDKPVTVTGVRILRTEQTIGTSEEPIALGEISAPAWAYFRNLDATNYLELKVATGGAIFAKLLGGTGGTPPGGDFCWLRLGSGAQAPYAIANTSPCQLEICIFET